VQDHMASHGLDLAKLAIVPNGITLDEWTSAAEPLPEGPLLNHLREQKAQGRRLLGYAGSHGLPNALDVLLDAAKRLQHSAPQLALVLVGSGHEKARLAERVRAEGLSNVALFEPIPKKQIPSLLEHFDIAYIGWQRTPIYRFGIAPNKLMDYMMARRPVLHSVEAGNDPVAEAGAGLTVAPEDAAAVEAGALRLAAMPAEELKAMGERGRAFVLANHTYPILAQRFLKALEP